MSMSMADLMAKQSNTPLLLTRGQEIEGTVIAISDTEIVLDLGTKAEGIIHRKDLSLEQEENLKVGSKLSAFVLYPENESGQALLTLSRSSNPKTAALAAKWKKFEDAKAKNQTLTGKGLEVNKGGLVVEVAGSRGFLPSSQVSLSRAANLEDLVGQDVEVMVIEIDVNTNRLIFSQKTKVSDETKKLLEAMKVGEEVTSKVAAVLPFGVFVNLSEGVDGLVHVSEISWEKVEDPNTLYAVGDEIKAKIVSVDTGNGRVNLSVKQLTADPFAKLAEDFQADDVVKGEVVKISAQGVNVKLKDGIEGFVPAAKLDPSVVYEAGQSTNFLVDNLDSAKRRVNLAPFLTSTDGLIYK